MKFLQIAFGLIIVGLGVMMLVIVLRGGADASGGANAGQAIIAPLSLIGVGALAISAARKKKKR